MSASVYRMYDDRGFLLYVGCSAAAPRRVAEHANKQPWWADVAHITVEHFDDLAAARRAERAAIREEDPVRNVQQTVTTRPIVATNIKARRAGLGLTQHQLAQRLGVDPQYVSRWERAAVLPSQANLAALALALHCDLGDFYAKEAA